MTASGHRSASPPCRRIAILGATGTIGVNSLDVASHLPDRVKVVGLSGHANIDRLAAQARQFMPEWVALSDPSKVDEARAKMPQGIRLLAGHDSLARAVAEPGIDMVVCAIVGAAGLESAWAALEAGKDIALANKETLVVGGPLVTGLARRRNARLLPVDSEHSALFQLLQEPGAAQRVERLVLTGSGGPFRGRTASQLAGVTIEQALDHPTWKMGPKITIDSATLMNKALEVIEARWLFDIGPGRLDVIIHPESVVHSFVEFVDGSVVAQASPPDMRLPIQYALTYPDRVPGPTRRMRWDELRAWHFERPDRAAFPALDLGFKVAGMGGTAGAALNAANEVAVARFLAGSLPFMAIPRLVQDILEGHEHDGAPDLGTLKRVDRLARQEAEKWRHTTAAMAE
ncbi:MAG: 1-deoxy-D-xylulose-5-phosphate reductoisomerase [Planctomycetota bacterium]